MRRLLSLGLLATVALGQDDVAALFPGDTFAYVELDANALEKGVTELQLVKLVADAKLQGFFKPTIDKLELDKDRPGRSLLEKSQIRQFLAGRAALGVRGATVTFREGEKESVVSLTRDRPLEAKTVYRLLGTFLAANRGKDVNASFSVDALLVLEPGPALKALVAKFLENPPVPLERDTAKVAGKEVTHFSTTVDLDRNWQMPTDVYADFGEKRWILATSKETLASALAGGPRSALATAPRFAKVKRRMAGEHALAFAFVDAVPAIRMAKNLIPPIVFDLNRINGIASLRGFGFGLSISQGGFRESLGLVLDGEPKGIWRLLDAMPGGLRSIEIAPPGALAVVGAKFDARILFQRIREVTAELAPGNEDYIEDLVAMELKRAGFDLESDVLKALGDEIAVFAYPADFGPIPKLVVGLDVRDEEAFGQVLVKLKKIAAASGEAAFGPLDLGDGIEGFRMQSRVPITAFAVHKGHLFGATTPQLLQEVLSKWGTEGAPSLRKDGKVFGQVLQGLNGGSTKNLAMVGYLNVRRALPQAWGMMSVLGVQLPADWLDVSKVPDVMRMANHLNGVAVGVRNDGDGLTLDVYSPMGMVVPAIAWATMTRRPARPKVVRVIPAGPRRGQAHTGITARGTHADSPGVRVFGMVDNGPAAKAGLQVQDLIVAIEGREIRGIEDMDREIGKCKPGQVIKLRVIRGDMAMDVMLTLGSRGEFFR